MFLQFYRLREQPFGVTPNPRYLYHGPAHREALASLIYGIEADLGFAALIAEPGMGKTTLLYYLLERFRSTARTAFIFQTQCDRLELLRYLANELEVPADETDVVVLNDRIRDVLVQEARAGRRVIVIIDEAQNLSEDALEAVRLLSDFETPDTKLMHIILSGQPELAEKLARPSMAQLLQRIAMLNRLSPFGDPEQVSHYLAYRLQVAGYTGPPLFTPDAVELISASSKGIPRQINRICFNAMSLGCAMQKRKIDGAIVREVLTDLDVATWLIKPGSGSTSAGPSRDDEPASPTSLKFTAASDVAGAQIQHAVSTSIPVPPPARPSPTPIKPYAADVPFVHTQAPLTAGALALSSQPAVAPGPVRVREASPASAVQPRPSRISPRDSGRPNRAIGAAAPSGIAARAKTKVQASTPRPREMSLAARDEQHEQRTSIRMVLLCALGVPLLLFAAWLYMEKQHMSPGFHQPASIEQSEPTRQGGGTEADHGTTVTLPESGTPVKPRKVNPGPRSAVRPASGTDERGAFFASRTREADPSRRVHEIEPSRSMAEVLVSFDGPRGPNEIDRTKVQ